jgi:DNA-binding NarL/FixJ family response regulator
VLVPALQDAGPHVVVTTREQEVFDLVVKGKSNKEIAKGLVISERTAKFHVSNLLAKYDVEGRGELVVAFLKAAE